MPETVVLLHGFGGTHRAWDGVRAQLDEQRYLALALDLPGHGQGAAPAPIGFAAAVQYVLERAPARFLLAGYSLGGRLALQVALAAPQRVTSLVLISTSAGIEDPAERERRRAADERLALELETGDYEAWIERWRSEPVFAGESAQGGALARADQLRNDPRALAAAMRALGAGAMAPLWERLHELQMPVALLAGSADQKYVAIAARMRELIPRAQTRVLDGSHGLLLERPDEIASVLQSTSAAARG